METVLQREKQDFLTQLDRAYFHTKQKKQVQRFPEKALEDYNACERAERVFLRIYVTNRSKYYMSIFNNVCMQVRSPLTWREQSNNQVN